MKTITKELINAFEEEVNKLELEAKYPIYMLMAVNKSHIPIPEECRQLSYKFRTALQALEDKYPEAFFAFYAEGLDLELLL